MTSSSSHDASPDAAPLAVGDAAPDISLGDHAGQTRSLGELRGQKVILYFYPKDMTPGCTTQACDLRDHEATLQQAGYTILGVSPDPPARHLAFRQKYELPFTLLADPKHVAARAFGVWREKNNYGKTYWGIVRSTFVIDEQGIITHILDNTRAKGHAERLIKLLIPDAT